MIDTKKTIYPSYNANYVFPVKSNKEKGLCNILTKIFKVTEPISWEILSLSNTLENMKINPTLIQNTMQGTQSPNIMLELIKGNPVPYTTTQFFLMEVKLKTLEANFLQEFS
jgi:hypothetical protein